MLLVEWSDDAQLDLADIQSYIEQFSPRAALDLRTAIEEGVKHLPWMPYAFRHGKAPGTREYVAHPNYVVIYRVDADAIVVLRILHTRRQYP